MNFHRRFTPLRVFTVALAVPALAAVPSWSVAQEKLRVGTPAAGFVYGVPLVVAQQLGYFAQLGLEVDVTNYRGGAVAQESLLTGDSDVANIGFGTLALAAAKGVKQRCVAVENHSYTGWMLVVPKDSKVAEVQQLDQARIGITAAGSVSDFLVNWVEQARHVKLDRIPLGAAGSLQAAAQGNQIAAYVTWPPNSYELIKRGAVRRVYDFGTEITPQYTGCWVAMDATAEKKTEALRKFGVAYRRAVEYMKANPEPALGFLVKSMGNLNRDAAADVYRDVFKNWTIASTVDPKMVQEALAFNKLPPGGTPERYFNEKFFEINKP